MIVIANVKQKSAQHLIVHQGLICPLWIYTYCNNDTSWLF